MKRAHEADGDAMTHECLWETLLCADMRTCILAQLDPLSRLLFALTNRQHHAAGLPVHWNVRTFGAPAMDMEELLFRYGTPHQLMALELNPLWHKSGMPGSYAAMQGNLPLLKWMHARGTFQIYSFTADSAAAGGQLAVLQWLQEVKKLIWSKQTLQQAVAHGSVTLLQWMVDNGCPEPHIQELSAVNGGNLPALKWLHARGHDMQSWRQELLDTATAMERSDIVQWINETIKKNIYDGMPYWEQEFDIATHVALPDTNDDDI